MSESTVYLSDPGRVGQVVEQHARHLLRLQWRRRRLENGGKRAAPPTTPPHLVIDNDESAVRAARQVARERRLVDLHRRRHLLVLGQLLNGTSAITVAPPLRKNR